MSARWVLHHLLASCQDCDWIRDTHGSDDREAGRILAAARRHACKRGHYVQVERGQHAHYRGESA